jgi:hypothetical protein
MKKAWFGWKKEWTGFALAVIVRLIYAGIDGGWFSGGPIPLNETTRGIEPLSTDLFSRYFVNFVDGIPFIWDVILIWQDASITFLPPSLFPFGSNTPPLAAEERVRGLPRG